jgi:hypothetical protein
VHVICRWQAEKTRQKEKRCKGKALERRPGPIWEFAMFISAGTDCTY